MTREGSPSPEQPAYRYAGIRDQALHVMARQGWANESDGSTECPLGHFYRLSYSPADLYEVVSAFAEDFEAIGFHATSLLTGHHLLREEFDGLVSVSDYSTEEQLQTVYDRFVDEYGRWQRGEL